MTNQPGHTSDAPEPLVQEPAIYSRRELFAAIPKAAVAAGVVAAGASVALSGCGDSDSSVEPDVLEVAKDQVTTLDSFTEVEDQDSVARVEDVVQLPAGALVFSSDDVIGAFLQPGDTSNPLSTISLMDMESGVSAVVLSQAQGHDQGYSLYEVRCSQSLLLWVESNYLTGDWRVYSAAVSHSVSETMESTIIEDTIYRRDAEGAPAPEEVAWKTGDNIRNVVTYNAQGEPVNGYYENGEAVPSYQVEDKSVRDVELSIGPATQLDEGDAEYDAPEIAVVESQAYWIVQPAEAGSKTAEDSYLKGSSGVLYTSHGRFCGGLTVSGLTLTALPRVDSSNSVYYQMTAFQNGAVVASQVLPHSFRPSTASYLPGGFCFGLSGSYDYGDGISSMGTYIPMGNGEYLRLAKTPVTAPGMVNGWVYCKSGSRTVFIDLNGKRYFTINPPSGSEDYGDYSVHVGTSSGDYVTNFGTVSTTSGSDVTRTVMVRRLTMLQAVS